MKELVSKLSEKVKRRDKRRFGTERAKIGQEKGENEGGVELIKDYFIRGL